MPEWPAVEDAQAREAALDVRRSFIVQAPAGSGKTGLLIQRYLALLATVEAPEEVVAITFTRKAAGEMRERVLAALSGGQDDAAPADAHARRTWGLARAVRDRDARLGWGIAASPGRLAIQTIDAFCLALVRRMPVLSGFGAGFATVEDATPHYREAARRTLASAQGRDATADQVGRVLRHLDNDVQVAESLVAGMLERRDQWLRPVVQHGSYRPNRERLEAGLRATIVDALEGLVELVPATVAVTLPALARHAARNLAQGGGADTPVTVLADLEALPGSTLDDLPRWRAVAELLLTASDGVRKAVDQRVGFPPGRTTAEKAQCKQWKQRMSALLEEVAAHPGFVGALALVRRLPPPCYSDRQWEVVGALTTLLPLAVAHLHLVFRARGEADFTAVSQAALRALGGPGEPTDLALALDHRIRHVLVDEFQDTSQSQYELLERLTAGWQPDDGRTLFLVGDPMQSIYRFRQAEVALYLRARREGVGSVRLDPLQLSVNFRSQGGIVRWVNDAFRALLPEVEDLESGAVSFSPSAAVLPELPGPAVSVHALAGRDALGEADRVVALVRDALSSGQSVAVLVRSRRHLAEIVPRLKDSGLRPQAIEIEQLGHRPVVQDLQALTHALLHPADRIAWLAVLRAPWCGLTLADLDALAGADRAACLWEAMQRDDVLARMTPDGRLRLSRVAEVFAAAFRERRRGSLRRWIEGAWLALGGPATVRDASDLDDARVFLDLLDALDTGGDLEDFEVLAERVARLFAQPDAAASEALQVMTIHKAKGLEFDVVVLPGLGARPRNEPERLLLWMERPRRHRGADLLLAPIRERGSDGEAPLYAYLARLEKEKARHEDGRLLYVAATRARLRLHLVGHAEMRAEGPAPARHSLLEQLWPVVAAVFHEAATATAVAADAEAGAASHPPVTLRRFPVDWRPPAPPDGIATPPGRQARAAGSGDIEFSWASETARHVGTVVHGVLQTIAEEGLEHWSAQRVEASREVLARDLRVLGVPEPEIGAALARARAALHGALEDPRGRWILSPHTDARCELRLTGVDGDEILDIAVDRTFVDGDGVRWIVDYKTGVHEGGDAEAFLDREVERYRAQLERYARLLASLDARPVRLGLYFPLMRGWRAWAPGSG
jgi:ATP-dependent exoDNAse (exonuclease V) beta subunit